MKSPTAREVKKRPGSRGSLSSRQRWPCGVGAVARSTAGRDQKDAGGRRRERLCLCADDGDAD